MSFEVLAPASSANLGPGFDSLALALGLYMRVRVSRAGDIAERALEDIDLYGGENLVASSMQHIARTLGRELPEMRVETLSDIPVARGLGSSAAAIVVGLQAGAAVLGEASLPAADLITIGGTLEGHADNISAAVLGGVTAAVATADGYLAARVATCLVWQPVLFIPRLTAFTRDARGVLPSHVPLPDAAANVGRSALLVHALSSGDDAMLAEAMADRLHQPYRERLFPHLVPMIAVAIAAGASGACLSGAGPAVLALARPERSEQVRQAFERIAGQLRIEGRAVATPLAPHGVVVQSIASGQAIN
jgi:homoserine kinase